MNGWWCSDTNQSFTLQFLRLKAQLAELSVSVWVWYSNVFLNTFSTCKPWCGYISFSYDQFHFRDLLSWLTVWISPPRNYNVLFWPLRVVCPTTRVASLPRSTQSWGLRLGSQVWITSLPWTLGPLLWTFRSATKSSIGVLIQSKFVWSHQEFASF